MQTDEHAPEREEGDDTQPGGKPVDTVYQVDGVQDIDDDEHGERSAYIIRHGFDAEKSVQVVEAESRSHQQDAAKYLYQKLGAVTYTDKVIHHTYKIKYEQTTEHGKQTVRQVHVEYVIALPKVVTDNGKRNRNCDTRKKGDTA